MIPALGTIVGAVGSVVKHVAGISHVENLTGKVPTSVPAVVEALGGRGVIGVIVGAYLANPDFRGHVDAAIRELLPF